MKTQKPNYIVLCCILFSIPAAAQYQGNQDVTLHKREIVWVFGVEGGLNTNVGDVGVHVDYFPSKTLALGAGVGTALGTLRWSAGIKFYAGDPQGGLYFFGAYSGNGKREGVDVSGVETTLGTNTQNRDIKVNVDPVGTINTGMGFQFVVTTPISIGAYAGYMFPTKKRDDLYTDPRFQDKTVNVSGSGNSTIIKEIPAGMMVGITIGYIIFN